jgi:hypothetical protein
MEVWKPNHQSRMTVAIMKSGGTKEIARRTRRSHNNTSARVLLPLLGAGDLHRARGVLDGEET